MVEGDALMSEAQRRFKEATNQVDRAYWLGAVDGEAAERERIIDLGEHWLVNDEQHIPRLCGGCSFIAQIKGEN